MKYKIPSTPEEFLAEVRKTQEELEKMRAASWLKTLKEIDKRLTQAGYPIDSAVRASLFAIMQATWLEGYSYGAEDMSRFFAREIGGNEALNMMGLMGEQLKQKPENN